jgi:hypothetical protein
MKCQAEEEYIPLKYTVNAIAVTRNVYIAVVENDVKTAPAVFFDTDEKNTPVLASKNAHAISIK